MIEIGPHLKELLMSVAGLTGVILMIWIAAWWAKK